MVVTKKNNEILVRFSSDTEPSKIQAIYEYLRYEELTSKSKVTEEELNSILNEAKADRYERINKELGLDD